MGVAQRVFEARTLSVSVDRPPDVVYAFTSDPRNLPRWSFFEAVEPVGDRWLATTPTDRVLLRFVEANALGVLDHDVEVAPGEVVHVPMRVVRNGDGSEVLFTLVRRPGMSDEAFEEDADVVRRDLAALRAVLEGG